MVALALPVARACGAGLVNARTIVPMDTDMLRRLQNDCKRVVVIEDGVDCLGKAIAAELSPMDVRRLHVPSMPVMHATVQEQREACGLTADALKRAITEGNA